MKQPAWRTSSGTGLLGGAWPSALAALITGLALLLAGASPARAATAELRDKTKLRVCADPGNLPFSNDRQEGFENRIAELLAEELGVPVDYTWYPMATGFVRQTLGARRCDLVIGISLGFELLQNTNPYYRSAYAMVFRAGDAAPSSLADPVLQQLRLGVIAGTPPAFLLARHGLMTRTRPYHLMVDTRFERPGEEMIHDLATGEIDVAILWGPIAGYYAKRAAVPLELVLLESEGAPRMDFRITMGIRFNEPDWKHRLNAFIEDRQADIDAILLEFGVPLLDAQGRRILPKPAAAVPEPEGYRMDHFRAPVPATLAGAEVVSTDEAKLLVETGRAAAIDVLPRPPKPAALDADTLWRPPAHHNIPGSAWLANTGFGALAPEVEAYFKSALERLSNGDKGRGLLFYCEADCWMSWNAAKRALAYGYTQVYWYPEGTDGWTAAGLETEKSEPVPLPN